MHTAIGSIKCIASSRYELTHTLMLTTDEFSKLTRTHDHRFATHDMCSCPNTAAKRLRAHCTPHTRPANRCTRARPMCNYSPLFRVHRLLRTSSARRAPLGPARAGTGGGKRVARHREASMHAREKSWFLFRNVAMRRTTKRSHPPAQRTTPATQRPCRQRRRWATHRQRCWQQGSRQTALQQPQPSCLSTTHPALRSRSNMTTSRHPVLSARLRLQISRRRGQTAERATSTAASAAQPIIS